MDPNANLQEQLRLAARARQLCDDAWEEISEEESQKELAAIGERLSELVLAMDEWLSNGGMLPKRWMYESE